MMNNRSKKGLREKKKKKKKNINREKKFSNCILVIT